MSSGHRGLGRDLLLETMADYSGEDSDQEDGWGMDDDVEVDDFDNWNDDPNDDDGGAAPSRTMDATKSNDAEGIVGDAFLPASNHSHASHNQNTGSTHDGWNDDNLELSETSRIENTSSPSKSSKHTSTEASGTGEAAAVSGWDDDFDLDDDAWTTEAAAPILARDPSNDPTKNSTTSAGTNATPAPATSQLYRDVQDYLSMLPKLTPSINAVLQAEYNTPAKAMELQQYYADRPALAKYTIEKELPRMDYILTDAQSGDIIDDKAAIAQEFAQESLCVRCANQSLLADILQVLTGHDRVIRTQYHATAIATQCRFRVDLGLSLVEVNATLDVSLPMEQGRWKVAELRVMISFECGMSNQAPMVDFRLIDIRPTVATEDEVRNNLHQCIKVLDMLAEMETDESHDMEPSPLNFRDAFLQSQNRFSASASNAIVGMKSAWQDFDAATGLHSKWKQLPTLLLPDANVWQEAALEEQREQERRLQLQSVRTAPAAPAHEAPRPPPPAQPQHRPTSILGGLVRSLAKTVALPEEDASLYQEWQPAPVKHSAAPADHRPPNTIPRFYNQETPRSQPKPTVPAGLMQAPVDLETRPQHPVDNAVATSTSESRIPRLYQPTTAGEPPSASAAPTAVIPKLYNTKTPPTVRKPTLSAAVSTNTRAPSLVAKTHEPEQEDKDGWDDDVEIDDLAVDTLEATRQTDDMDASTWQYDPVTDIIPTRTRWVNPTRIGKQNLFVR